MKYLVMLIAAFVLISGCGTTRQAENVQVLVKVSPLPAYEPASGPSKHMEMRVGFRVLGDGTIAEVHIVKSPADAEWNAVAIDKMKEWQFSPVSGKGDPEGRWIQYSIVVRVEEPIVIRLGEITAVSEEDADSLYALLDNDVPFESIAKQAVLGSGESAKFLGAVDIATYPQHVRNELRKLGVNQFTRPLRLGDRYVIYVRFKEENSRDVVQ